MQVVNLKKVLSALFKSSPFTTSGYTWKEKFWEDQRNESISLVSSEIVKQLSWSDCASPEELV